MSVLENLVDTGVVASQVNKITDNRKDAAVAAGYNAWIESVTGQPVYIQETNGYAELILSKNQAIQMQRYFENMAFDKTKSDSKLKINFSPVTNPLLIKYGVPAIIGIFALGFFARGIIK